MAMPLLLLLLLVQWHGMWQHEGRVRVRKGEKRESESDGPTSPRTNL